MTISRKFWLICIWAILSASVATASRRDKKPGEAGVSIMHGTALGGGSLRDVGGPKEGLRLVEAGEVVRDAAREPQSDVPTMSEHARGGNKVDSRFNGNGRPGQGTAIVATDDDA
ncbi:hypothetical protein B0H13DRAFT_2319155 [Mycena leptocephala]|nr:hypothetical protein B0H13DRAFT_2319155 [Mycena leptocephala]